MAHTLEQFTAECPYPQGQSRTDRAAAGVYTAPGGSEGRIFRHYSPRGRRAGAENSLRGSRTGLLYPGPCLS